MKHRSAYTQRGTSQITGCEWKMLPLLEVGCPPGESDFLVEQGAPQGVGHPLTAEPGALRINLR